MRHGLSRSGDLFSRLCSLATLIGPNRLPVSIPRKLRMCVLHLVCVCEREEAKEISGSNYPLCEDCSSLRRRAYENWPKSARGGQGSQRNYQAAFIRRRMIVFCCCCFTCFGSLRGRIFAGSSRACNYPRCSGGVHSIILMVRGRHRGEKAATRAGFLLITCISGAEFRKRKCNYSDLVIYMRKWWFGGQVLHWMESKKGDQPTIEALCVRATADRDEF